MMQALVQMHITVIGKFLDVKSLTQFQSCSSISLSGNKETYTLYKKLYDEGIEESQKRVNQDMGLSYLEDIPWPYDYYAYKMSEARLQWVNSLMLKRVFVNVPLRAAAEGVLTAMCVYYPLDKILVSEHNS